MTPMTPSRRAAEEFASVLDGSRPDLADRYADLAGTVGLLERHDPVTPRPEYVADLRARLMDAADTLLLPADAEPAAVIPLQAPDPAPGLDRARRRERRLGAVAVAFVLVGGSAGVAAAAEGSLPGDTLYPIKRSLESARVTLNPSDRGKGSDLLGQADTRLREVADLVSANRSDRIDQALADFETSAAKGSDLILASYQRDGDPAGLDQLRDFAATQMGRLQTMAEQAPASSQDAFASAASLLADIDQQAGALCTGCGGSLLEIPHALLESASSLSDLLSIPTSQAGGSPGTEVPTAASELAQAAQNIAKSLPSSPAPLAPPVAAGSVSGKGGATGSGGSGGILGDNEITNQVTGPVKTVTNAVTGGVGQTLGILDGITGGMTAPLTGLVTDTVDTLVNTILGTGASNASGRKNAPGAE